MSSKLFTIARIASRDLFFGPIAAELGFQFLGEIDRFVFNVYAKVIKDIPSSDRLRGAIFVLEPAAVPDALGITAVFQPMFEKIQAQAVKAFYSVRVDLAGGLTSVYTCTPEDRKSLVSGGWPQKIAQLYSRTEKKCVIWAMAVGVHVYLNGDLYLESADVIEEFAVGLPGNFQSLSWDDGGIVFEFARHRLNDTSAGGVWHLPEQYLLRPKPEVLMRSLLGEFLRSRLAGYHHHDEEPHVEHEGRADISLHLIDDRILIIEVKWIGCSLVATRMGAAKEEIKAALARKKRGWITRFDDKVFASGVRQLVGYYRTGKYRAAYLVVFDCGNSNHLAQSCYVPVPIAELEGSNPSNFRILRASVDPRSASRRAKS